MTMRAVFPLFNGALPLCLSGTSLGTGLGNSALRAGMRSGLRNGIGDCGGRRTFLGFLIPLNLKWHSRGLLTESRAKGPTSVCSVSFFLLFNSPFCFRIYADGFCVAAAATYANRS